MNLTTTGSYCLLFIFLIFKVEAQTVTLEMEFDSNKIQQGDYMSPVTTYKNSIYTVWIDDKSRLVIAKKSNGLTITKVIFASGVPDDPFHVAPSIGIDRDGYIHIAGNMHHSPFNNLDENPHKDIAWQYWVSDKPEDISSFSFKGDTQQAPPGNWISYPYFQQDGKGNLYVTYRHRVSFNGGWVGGVLAGAVARYEPNNRTWTMLGGTMYRHGIKTLAWTGKPTSATAYEGYKPRLHIDAEDKLHFVAVGVAEPGGARDGTHVFYAYSDDLGNTWKKSNGAVYTSLPFTQQNGETAFSVNWAKQNSGSDQGLYNIAHVGVLSNGNPVVSCERNSQRYVTVKASDGGWSDPKVLPSSFPSRIITSNDGIVYAIDNEKIQISEDNTNSWKAYDVPLGVEQNAIFDAVYLRETNKVRYQALFRSGNNYVMRVYTLDFGFATVDCTPAPSSGSIPVGISSSENDLDNFECNIMDGDMDTRWSAEGDGQWIMFDLGSVKSFDRVDIAFYKGNERAANFDIQVSSNGTSWTNVLTDINSSGTSLAFEPFTFPLQSKRYLRYLGRGNSVNGWNSLTELKIPTTAPFNIQDYSPPTSVVPGESYTIKVPYTGAGAAEMHISLQDTDNSWVTEGFASMTVSGSGTVSLDLTVNPKAEPGNNYLWQAYITPLGKGWKDRYDNKSVGGIQCVAGSSASLVLKESGTSILLYPNPANDRLVLGTGGSGKSITGLAVLDSQGRLVEAIPVEGYTNGDDDISLDVSSYGEGTYILKVTLAGGEKQNSRFIIKR